MSGLDFYWPMPLADTFPSQPRTDAPDAPLQAWPGYGEPTPLPLDGPAATALANAIIDGWLSEGQLADLAELERLRDLARCSTDPRWAQQLIDDATLAEIRQHGT